MRIGVIGATGTLGREVVAALAEAALDEGPALEPPILLATAASAGEEVAWVDEEGLEVEEYTAEALRGLDAAIVAAPEPVARKVVEELRRLGVPTVDASRAHRATAPLVGATPPVPGTALVALPGAEALLLSRVLAPLLAWQPGWVRATLLRPSSSLGQLGVRELAEGSGKLLNGQEPETPRVGHRLAYNLVPQVGAFAGATTEAEADLATELPRLLGQPVAVGSTVALGPWFYGYFATLTVALAARPELEAVRAALRAGADLKLLDDPGEHVYPMPSLATGDEAVLVGRVRADPIEPGTVQLVAAVDGARAMAVLAVRTARALARARTTH